MLLLSLLPLRSSFLILFIMIWHIRYLLCYLKTPFGEWGEYIYIKKKQRGVPPLAIRSAAMPQPYPRSPCRALVPRSHGLPVLRVRPCPTAEQIQQQSLAGQMLDTARLVALLPFSTACECVQSIYYFLVTVVSSLLLKCLLYCM